MMLKRQSSWMREILRKYYSMRPHTHRWTSCTRVSEEKRIQTGRRHKLPMDNSSANTGETTQIVKTLRKVSWPTTPFGISLPEFPKRICKLFSKLYPIKSLILTYGSQILNILDHNGAALHASTHYQCTMALPHMRAWKLIILNTSR